MNLNLDKLNHMKELGLLDYDFFKSVLEQPDSYSKMRYQDNVGKPWGFWDDIANLLEGCKPNINDLHYYLSTSKHYVLNLANFLPSEFCDNFGLFASVYQNLSYKESCLVLHNKSNFNAISNFYSINEPCGKLSAGCLLAFLFCCFTNNVSFEKYNYLFKFVDESKGDIANVCDLLHSTQNNSEVNFNINKPRVALFVTGQVRSELTIVNNLKKALDGYEVDLLFSSWKKKGGTAIKKAQIHRYFTSEALMHMKNHGHVFDDDFVKFFDDERSNYISDLSHSEIEEYFDFCSECYINIDDESLAAFSKLSNAEKMYYHNSVWVKRLGKKFFNKYDIVFKVRPDIEFTSIEFDNMLKDISDNNFVTEDHGGWIFRNWGFGVGDQILIGRPRVLIPLLDIFDFDEADISCKLQKDTLRLEPYIGHVNIAIKSVINGFSPLPNSYFKIIFSDYKKLGLDKVLKYLEK